MCEINYWHGSLDSRKTEITYAYSVVLLYIDHCSSLYLGRCQLPTYKDKAVYQCQTLSQINYTLQVQISRCPKSIPLTIIEKVNVKAADEQFILPLVMATW